MSKLTKVLIVMLILLLVIPATAQEGTEQAEPDVTESVVMVDETDAPEMVDAVDPVIVVSGDEDYNFIGIIVVGAIAIVMQLVNGFTNGRFLQTAETAVRRYVLENEPLGNQIETRVSRWDERDRRYVNSILDVVDRNVDFKFTDLDDDTLAWFRDKFDGVVEPAGDGVSAVG